MKGKGERQGSFREAAGEGPARGALLPAAARAGLINLVLAAPLFAIPSPDMVVSFFASAAQVLGLVTVLLGSFAFAGRRRARLAGRPGAPPAALRWSFCAVLVLLLLSLGANLLQYSSSVDERNRRLRTNLWRSSKESGKKVGDVNLKTLAVSDQLNHPQGVATGELARWIAEGRPLNLIDVREPEEVEMGIIAGSWARRYPDLSRDHSGLVVEGKETVLLCESGNRSSELCGEFLKEDHLTKFMIGGYEKWVAENRPLQSAKPRSPGEIRDIPEYPNKWTLLDTPEVLKLVEREDVLFVDVRYPGEFDQGHLPGAVNLTLRRMPLDEMWAELKKLPRRPIVAPCYDKRSSFYGMILGLRLHRLGYDFRGRYTVPHEYCASSGPQAYVQEWLDAQNRGVLGTLQAPLKDLLLWVDSRVKHLAAAILIMVILLRLLVLPLTLKSDRDQLVMRRLQDEIASLKQRIGDDRQRLSRALIHLQRKHGITPVRNLLGTMAQVLLFVLFFGAVSGVAGGAEGGFLWLNALSSPDPLFLLPLILGGIVFLYLQLNAAKGGALRLTGRMLGSVLLFAITFRLAAAVNIYLIVSLALMLFQNRLTVRFLARRRPAAASAPDVSLEGVVPLRLAHRSAGAGNKARRLGQMMEAGLEVPYGFVLTAALLFREGEELRLGAADRRRIAAEMRRLKGKRVAVRSSGLNEDGAGRSYAGIFESLLNISPERLYPALDEVRRSLSAARASAYGGGAETGGVLVQEMVDAEYAGVLFTEHPYESGSALVEMVAGLGDALVSGTATPQAYRLGRESGRLLDAEAPPIDLAPLFRIGTRVEKLFGGPQDVEWAYSRGRFFVLQSRHITALSRTSPGEPRARQVFEGERHRLLALASGAGAEEVVFAQNELSELLPRPTPLSLSLLESLWKPGGTTDLACRALGVPYDVREDAPPFVTRVFGALYVNRREEKLRTRRAVGAIASFRLARAAAELEREFRDEFLPAYLREVVLREAIDFSRLETPELFRLFRDWSRRFAEEIYFRAELINIAAASYVELAERKLEQHGLPAAAYLAHLPETVVHRAMAALPEIRAGRRPVTDFLELFGHRAPHDFELAQPRYGESAELVRDLIRRAPAACARREVPRPQVPPGNRLLALAVERARTFQSLKEEAKHHSLRDLALLRKLLLEIDGRLELGGDVFYLEVQELELLENPARLTEARRSIAERKAEAEVFRSLQLPPELSLLDLESLSPEGEVRARGGAERSLRGTLVAGGTEVQGAARVITSPEEIDSFEDGEVLVARYTDPTWTPLFPKAAGIITEVGGWLSHAAIVAREYNVTTVVGVPGALARIKTGHRVMLHTDGSIDVWSDRRGSDRFRVSARVALSRQGELVEALLLNISRSGALVNAGPELLLGQKVRLKIAERQEEISAEVVRQSGCGGYALRFATPLAAPVWS